MFGIVANPSGVLRTLNVGVRAQTGANTLPFYRQPGIQPNDFQLARQYSWYTPVQHGWIVGRNNFWPQGALDGTRVFGGVGAAGFGGAASSAAAAAASMIALDDHDPHAETRRLISDLVQAEKLKSKMAVISAGAVVLMAVLGVISFARTGGKNL